MSGSTKGERGSWKIFRKSTLSRNQFVISVLRNVRLCDSRLN